MARSKVKNNEKRLRDYEYEIILILSIARAWISFILAGKRDSRRHSTTGFSTNVLVVGTSYQM